MRNFDLSTTWEEVESLGSKLNGSLTSRLKVPGGWLYRDLVWNARDAHHEGFTVLGLAFVPDASAVNPIENPPR